MAEQQIASGADSQARGDIRFPVVTALSILCIFGVYYASIAYFYAPSSGSFNWSDPIVDVVSLISSIFTLDLAGMLTFAPWMTLIVTGGVLYRMFSWFGFEGKQSFAGNLFNDSGTRNYFFELLLILTLGWLIWALVGNATVNLQKAGIASGFGFMSNAAGFGLNFSPFIDYLETSSFSTLYLVGLQNTLVLAVIGIIFATIFGFIVGIARLSQNWVISKISYWYVEILRNIPLLLQIFIWYKGVGAFLPPKREPWDLGVLGQLNAAGLFAPKPVLGAGASWIFWAFLAGIVVTWLIGRWSKKRQMATGERFPVFWTGMGLIIGLPILVYLLLGRPLDFEYAIASNFGPRGGMQVIPEFIALLLALSLYTAAFIAEIVRAGILAVNKGQTEASSALGLSRGQGLRLVVVPQAMRVIIPPLTSQYLNLTKNSSLAVAIAYPDLTAVFAGTALNQTGQAVEILLMTMLTYLAISLITSMFMNWYNAKMALVER